MDTLPKEIVKEIIMLIEDKIYISMVCKSWITILDEIFCDLSKDNINYNDSYHLKLYLLKYSPIYIAYTSNLNSLNLICLPKLVKHRYPHGIFRIHYNLCVRCENDYVSNKNHLNYMIRNICFSGTREMIIKSLDLAFKHKSYNILIIMWSYIKIRETWIVRICERYKSKYNSIEQLINEIEFLKDNHVACCSDIYEIISTSPLNPIIKEKILTYISQWG